MSLPPAAPHSSAPAIISAVVADGRLIGGAQDSRPLLWWSYTKTVLAAAALALVRDGQLTLDTTLPGRPYTLRQLLSHQAGVPNYSELPAYTQAVALHEAPWSPSDMLARVQHERLLFAPGQGWRYSNTAYLLLRQLIEEHCGVGLQQALEQLVLTPLAIEGVQLAQMPADIAATAWGNPDDYHPGWVYHGLLTGSAASAALLLDRLLCGRLLPPHLLAEMTQQITLGQTLAGRPASDFGYGLGLMLAKAGPAGPSCGHSGAGPLSVAAVYRFADCGRTVACFAPLTNEAMVEWAAHRLAMQA